MHFDSHRSFSRINQSIQSILFLIKCYIINAPSAVQWNTHISLNTYIYIQWNTAHLQAFIQGSLFGADTMFSFQAHTLSHSWTLRAARAFFILGNPSLVLKSPPGVPPSMLQPRQHHSRPTLIQPLVALLSLSRYKRKPIFCVTGKQANHSTTTATLNDKNDSKSIYNKQNSILILTSISILFCLLYILLLSFLKRTYVSRDALNLNFIKLQYEDFTSCFFTFIYSNTSALKSYKFEISTLDDFLILFIKLNTNFLLKGGKFKTSQIRNSQEGLKDEETFIKTLNTLLKATLTLPIVLLRYLVHDI